MALIKRKKKSENISDLIKLVKDDETYKGRDGKDGITPDEPYLISLIKPLIPKVRNGFDGKDAEQPTPEYLSSLIKPLIPKVKDGETPDNKRLIELIKPLLPKTETVESLSADYVIEQIKSKDNIFGLNNIKGIHEYIDRRIPLNMIGSPRIKMFNGGSEMSAPLGSLNVAGSGFTLTNNGQDYLLTLTGGDLSGYVPYTGADTNLDMGTNTITALSFIGSGASLTGIDHNTLSNLTVGDVHTQYALLAGRSGGQTLIGGTVSGNNLTLQSTSHATKGKLIFGTSAYDEVNNRLGVGTATPTAKFHMNAPVASAVTNPEQFRIDDGTTGGYFSISEGGSGASIYLPIFRFQSAGINGGAGGFIGQIPAANDSLSSALAAIVFDGRRDTGVSLSSSNTFLFRNYTTQQMMISAGGSVAIGTHSPVSARLHVTHTAEQFRVGYDTLNYMATVVSSTGAVSFDAVGSGKSFIFNQAGADCDFRVEGDTNQNLLFVDASTDRIGIGTATPEYMLDVQGDINVIGASNYWHGGNQGVTGTFTSADGYTVEVKGGIITAIQL